MVDENWWDIIFFGKKILIIDIVLFVEWYKVGAINS